MAKKGNRRCDTLPILHPDAAGTFVDAPEKTMGSHYTDIDRAAKVFALMLEGRRYMPSRAE
jgi:hypothetical protein